MMSPAPAYSIAGLATFSKKFNTDSATSSGPEATILVVLSVVSVVVHEFLPTPKAPPKFPTIAVPHSFILFPHPGFQTGGWPSLSRFLRRLGQFNSHDEPSDVLQELPFALPSTMIQSPPRSLLCSRYPRLFLSFLSFNCHDSIVSPLAS